MVKYEIFKFHVTMRLNYPQFNKGLLKFGAMKSSKILFLDGVTMWIIVWFVFSERQEVV